MEEKAKKGVSRREFFEEAAKGALFMGCLSIGVGEAWAQSVKTGQPLLTVENLNKFYQANIGKPTYDKYISEAKTNLQRFLEQHFSLTSGQKNYFKDRYRLEKPKLDQFITTIEKETRKWKATKGANPPPHFEPGSEGGHGGRRCNPPADWKCVGAEFILKCEYCWCG